MKWFQIIALAFAVGGCSDSANSKAPRSRASDEGGLHLTLNTMAEGYDLKIKINGVDLGSLKPSQPEFSTVALQLYGTDNAMKKEAKGEDANLFSLREGENEMEVSFDLVEPGKVGLLGLRITVVSPSVGLAKPILDFQQDEPKSGRFKARFDSYEKMPQTELHVAIQFNRYPARATEPRPRPSRGGCGTAELPGSLRPGRSQGAI